MESINSGKERPAKRNGGGRWRQCRGTAERPGIRSLIPARIDRLPWSRFHTRMVMALGVAWVLDGLEITIAAQRRARLTSTSTLHLSPAAVGVIATVYLLGEVIGALFFGRLSDKLGRRNLFMITLGVYLVGSGLTALTLGTAAGWVVCLYATRFIAGMGIGGEYAAINSAIDELIPARYRGRVDIAVNGTYWAGALIGTRRHARRRSTTCPARLGWRVAFLFGPVLGLVILFVRRNLPESPRWQIMHGRERGGRGSRSRTSSSEVEADRRHAAAGRRDARPSRSSPPTRSATWPCCERCSGSYPGGRCSAPSLMITQSFLYNAIFFTYAPGADQVLPRPDGSDAATTSSPSRSATCSGR